MNLIDTLTTTTQENVCGLELNDCDEIEYQRVISILGRGWLKIGRLRLLLISVKR